MYFIITEISVNVSIKLILSGADYFTYTLYLFVAETNVYIFIEKINLFDKKMQNILRIILVDYFFSRGYQKNNLSTLKKTV